MEKKPKIRFHYGDKKDESDDFKSVTSVHKGPIQYSSLVDTMSNPTYEEISFDGPSAGQNYADVAKSHGEMVNVPLSEAINQGKTQASRYSPVKGDGKEVLQSGAYYNVGPNGESVTRLESGVGSPFTKQKTPELNEDLLRETDFKRESIKADTIKGVSKGADLKNENPQQIVLKSPSFKYQPQTQGDMGVLKKEYVRADKTETYKYNGIPEKKEQDFLGCFGCCSPKPKTYTTVDNKGNSNKK